LRQRVFMRFALYLKRTVSDPCRRRWLRHLQGSCRTQSNFRTYDVLAQGLVRLPMAPKFKSGIEEYLKQDGSCNQK
jgi:hypothetical protein